MTVVAAVTVILVVMVPVVAIVESDSITCPAGLGRT